MTKAYPWLIYFIALGVLLLNSLPTNYVVGTDIHLEYYFAQLALKNGWDSSIDHPVDAALGVNILAPMLSRLLGIPLVWVFKAIFPALFALVPVILYLIYSRYWSKRDAFLSALFFISVPTFIMELPGITRQQIAEVFLALFFLVMLRNLPGKVKYPMMLVLAAGVIVSHYSSGVVLLLILGLYLLFRAGLSIFLRKEIQQVWTAAALLLVVASGAVVYFGWAGGGTPLRYMGHLIPIEETQVGPYKIGRMPANTILAVSGELVVADVSGVVPQYDSLMRVAVGLDFADATSWGKAFRIIQYITQALVLVGFLFMLIRRKANQQYLLLTMASAAILGLCLMFSIFAAILNATRWYHLALFFLAPMPILVFTALFKKPILFVAILIPYALFTTGVIFEVTKQDNIANPNLPYSAGLSGYRLDLTGRFTKEDEAVRDWLAGHSEIKTIYADVPGVLFLQETLTLERNIHFWQSDTKPKSGTVLFLRSQNGLSNTLTVWTGVGSRKPSTLDASLSQDPVLVQVGNSRVLALK